MLNIAKQLIELGADIGQLNEYGTTPLHLCGAVGLIEIAEILIQKNVNLNIQNIVTNWTPIHTAIFHKESKIVQLLCDSGADLEVKTHKGKSVLEFAQEMGNSEIIAIIAQQLNKISKLKMQNEAKRTRFDDCIICFNPRQEIFVMVPCGHAKTCKTCCETILSTPGTESKCPVCRTTVTSHYKVFH